MNSPKSAKNLHFPWLAAAVLMLGALLLPTSVGRGSIAQAAPSKPGTACAGGPVIDGITLDECYDETFTVGGVSKTVRVWYTKSTTTATRMVDGVSKTLYHWIDTDAEAVQVAQWGRDAWERYYAVFGHHPYDTGCGDRINVQMEDGVGWLGIAYWASSGSCRIGIDSPMVRGGNGQFVVYHEFQHYLQYSYDSGCYGFLRPNYSDDSEFVEGYADLGADSVNAASDLTGYGGITYDPSTSMYAKSYGNIFNKYFIEQLGSMYTAADAWYHLDALKKHYEACDTNNTLYVLNTLIPSLKAGMTEEKLFTNFFAANWSKDWANAASQPELVYLDDDGNPYGNLAPVVLDENITTGSPLSYSSESTPDKWAARYYQVTPQSGCKYVQANVTGDPGAHLGINLMAARTTAPTAVQRFVHIGEDFSRTFQAYGTYNRIVAAVNAFDTNFAYGVSFSCVTPVLNILEPRQTNFAMVGAPDSPIAFLARFSVKDGANPILGINESALTVFAGTDAAAIVLNSLQQVGEEYWMVVLPPVKPVGTTFSDLKICLDGTLCDTELNALLYVAPGHTDQALVFDGSGSMATEDVVGDGTRLANAQKAGAVMADLLTVGDRVLVTSFSATDSPAGCGLPGGTGNCPIDILTTLARLDVTSLTTDIAAVKTAISAITARQWTPIGAGLVDAKTKLLAGTANTNPKHIILLSDGEENVNPLYSSISAELIDSGVVIDTIGFSGDASPALLAQIAADTGGTYRYVATSGVAAMPPAGANPAQSGVQVDAGVPAPLAAQAAAVYQPGPLALDNVYDYLDSKNQGGARLGYAPFTSSADGVYQLYSASGQYVDASVSTLRILVAGKQADATCGFVREVEVADPTVVGPNARWFPVSPRTGYTPTDWDIRNSPYDDVVVIKNPLQGTWQVRARYVTNTCTPGAPQAAQGAATADFIITISAETSVSLQGRFLAPLVSNQGSAGVAFPIAAVLLDKTGALPGATVVAFVEKPVGTSVLLLVDDGNHADGAANDGIYGQKFAQTALGGSYNVRIAALYPDPTTGKYITREWMGGFWIDGPSKADLDQDGMPDRWELACKLDPNKDDSRGDLDNDGLVNLAEFQNGTSPCNPDTDRGGEKDGSEVNAGRNPLIPDDDKLGRLTWHRFIPYNGGILVRWSPPVGSDYILLSVREGAAAGPKVVQLANTGEYDLRSLSNDVLYTLSLAAGNSTDGADGAFSEPEVLTPKADPSAPVGTLAINAGDASTKKLAVTLTISATDTPLDGMAYPSSGSLAGQALRDLNVVSGGVQMRVSNDPSFAGASWQALTDTLNWQLAAGEPMVKRVYIQFRDAALNESLVVSAEIQYYPQLYLPVVKR